jgi:alpha-1,2-mannosyltransferase
VRYSSAVALRRWQKGVLAALFALCAATAIYEARQLVVSVIPRDLHDVRAANDFGFYYQAARTFFTEGGDPYDDAAIRSHHGFNYPPPSLAFFLPFLAVPPGVAFLVFIALSYCVLPFCAGLVRRAVTPEVPPGSPQALLLLALTVVIGPQFQNVTFGQVNTLALLCCLGYVRLVERERPILGGFVLSLGCWLKVFPALLAFVALRDARYRRALLGVALGGVLVPILLSHLVPLPVYVRYFREVLPTLSELTTGQILNASIPAVVARAHMTTHAELLGDEMFAVAPLERALLTGATLALVAGLALVYLRRSTPERRATAAAIVLAAIPLVVPLGWGYTYILALPLLWLVLSRGLEAGGWRLALALAALLALFVPSHTVFPLTGMPVLIAQFVYARYPVAALVMMALAIRPRVG